MVYRMDNPDDLGWLNRLSEDSSDSGSDSTDKQFEKIIGRSYHRHRKVRETGAQLTEECINRIDEAHRQQVWPDDITKSPTWTGDDDVTVETQEWVETVLKMEDPMWDEYNGVPMAAALTVKQELKDSLTQHQGWSIDSIQSRLEREFPKMEKHERVRIVRQEVAGVLNKAKITAIQAKGGDPLVRWVGPNDDDSTELCKSLADETKDGVPMSEFMEVIEQYAKNHGGTPNRASQGLPHFQCRYTIELVE